jgi:DNA replication regulator DPB11
VKLRPADAEAVAASRARMAQSAISTAWALDSDGEELEGESASLDPCPRPFKGIIVCATGLVDKVRLCCSCVTAVWAGADSSPQASLFKKAVEIGAKPLSDLTDKVTHLVAEEYGSAKYKVRGAVTVSNETVLMYELHSARSNAKFPS